MSSRDGAGGAPGEAGARYSERYADAAAVARRQRDVVTGWVRRPQGGAVDVRVR